jgi:hypothetical protein
MMTLDEAKAALPLSVLWSRLGLPGNAPDRDGVLVSCPFPAGHRNGDRKPSFNFHGGGKRFKCFACDIEGGAVDLLGLALGLDEKAACRKLIELAGGAAFPVARVSSTVQVSQPYGITSKEERPRVDVPPLRRGGFLAWRALERSRSVSSVAVDLASRFGVLRFGEVCGFPSWVLMDGSQRAVEARRMGRLPYPPVHSLGERKAHSLKGTDKSWPLALDVLRVLPTFRAVMLVEGGPDFLAALHFLNALEVWDVWPVAMLGRSTGGAIHAEALKLLAGRKVRIYPHADSDGGGEEAARKWGRQLAAVGCAVDGFSFAGLRQSDGSPVKDLNDCCLIHPDDAAKLGGLLP